MLGNLSLSTGMHTSYSALCKYLLHSMSSARRPETRRSVKGGDNKEHDLAYAAMVRDIFHFRLKEKGWKYVTASGLYTNKFFYKKNIKEGIRGMHYAMDDGELGKMIEKYGMDHSPEDPNHQYVALPLEDRKTVEEIHDELFPKKTEINADKKREADASNLNEEEKMKKKQKKKPPPVRVSASPPPGGNAGGCNVAIGSSSLDEASGHSPDTTAGRSPDAAADNNSSSGGSLALASGDGNTSGGAVTIEGGDGSTATGGSVTISSCVGTATSSGSVAVSTSSAGTAGVSGDLLLSTGSATVGDSGTLDIGSGSSVSISPSSGGNAGGCNAAKTPKQLPEDKNFKLQVIVAADKNWIGKMAKSLGIVHSKLAALKGAEPEMREAAKDQLLLALREALHKAENEDEEMPVVERD